MRLSLLLVVLLFVAGTAQAQEFEKRVHNVGNVGLTVTNAGFFGEAQARNNPSGPPSFEYPLDSGIEHLFEAGLWVGARRADGTITVRTGAVTSTAGYAPGNPGYELIQLRGIAERSSLVDSPYFTRQATSHQDFLTAYSDTATVIPGSFQPPPDLAGRLGFVVEQQSYAWNFPFTEYFVIVNFEIVNVSSQPWDSVYVGIWDDLVVRNVNTTNDTGSNYFNRNGLGFIDDLHATYAFNAGGTEETINTYGSIAFLGAEWPNPQTGQHEFFHPNVADRYTARGQTAPTVTPRWWFFGSNPSAELSRPNDDLERFRRMGTPYPDPAAYGSQEQYLAARDNFRNQLRTGGLSGQGNYIGLTSVGPFPRVAAGDTLKVTFAFVAALKPEQFQGQAGKAVDTEESRSILRNNLQWAQRTYRGEDTNYNGVLDPGEDVNGNGVLDRYLIPEPPRSPNVRVELESGKVTLYWDRSAEESIDPVSGEQDFEGYRVYRSNPGDDRQGDVIGQARVIAQYDRPGNRTGINNGFEEIRLDQPVMFPDDPREYWYKFEDEGLASGWQYAYAVTAFDEGEPDSGLESFESSRVATARRVFPGTPAVGPGEDRKVGVYPNPYRVNAAWDGGTNRTRKLNFYNLPARSEIRIYTTAGEVVKELFHDAATYQGDIRWYDNFSGPNRILPGGEHSWDILSENALSISPGLYFFSVKDLDTGEVQTGKFVIIK